MIEQITPDEAKARLDSGQGYVYIDVRSEAEYEQGHAAGAINVPIKHLNPQTNMLEDNPDFLAVMEANFDRDARLLLGCASGQRSNLAAMLLQQRGFKHVANIQCGFSGVRDMFGNVRQPGWAQLGYPTETGNDSAGSYEKARAKLES